MDRYRIWVVIQNYFALSGVLHILWSAFKTVNMEHTSIELAKWKPGRLIAFRFLFIYFLLFIFPFPLSMIPFSGLVIQPLSQVGTNLVNEIVAYFLGSDYTPNASPNGSGDTTFNYVQHSLIAVCSVFFTVGWTLLDSNRRNHEKLQYWLTILLRYYLAVVMLNYGFAKVFRMQFPFPSMQRLAQPYGESSPMGLLWTFMGYSTAYNIFAGLCEVVGGLLLFFKRTTLLGALIVVATMTNVVMLNLCYDVPVKLYSMHLLAAAICIIIPDMHRLLRLFLFNKSTEAAPLRPVYHSKKTMFAYYLGKGLLIAYLLAMHIRSGLSDQRFYSQYSERERQQSISGEYDVEAFLINGDTIPPTELVTRRWKKITIGNSSANIQNMDGASIPWKFHSSGRKIVMVSPDLSTFGNFKYQRDSSMVTMSGVLNQDTLNVVLTRKSKSPFLLVDRGFHWVNEFPFNR